MVQNFCDTNLKNKLITIITIKSNTNINNYINTFITLLVKIVPLPLSESSVKLKSPQHIKKKLIED